MLLSIINLVCFTGKEKKKQEQASSSVLAGVMEDLIVSDKSYITGDKGNVHYGKELEKTESKELRQYGVKRHNNMNMMNVIGAVHAL